MMISIKKFLERRDAGPEHDLLQASLQMSRLLLDGMSTHMVRGSEADFKAFTRALKKLLHKMDGHASPFSLLEISSEAVEILETYSQQTGAYLREQSQQLQSIVGMLTDTLADVSGQCDETVGRLQVIEQQIVRTRGLDDMRALTASLETCLESIREASARQKETSSCTMQRLQKHIRVAQERISSAAPQSSLSHAEIDQISEMSDEDEPQVEINSYVAVFKLHRADHIATRFGESARHQMLALISQNLKEMLGPADRLLRWKGTSFVMFLNSAASIQEIRAQIAETVSKTGQHYVELGKNAALLSIVVDWIVFSQAQCASLDAVFAEVDAFLASNQPANSNLPGAGLMAKAH